MQSVAPVPSNDARTPKPAAEVARLRDGEQHEQRKNRGNHPPGDRPAGPDRTTSRGHTEPVPETLTLTAVFTPDENGWTMAQLAEWPAVVTCGRTVEEARELLLDAAREMIASYRDEGREPPIGGGHAEQVTIDLAAA